MISPKKILLSRLHNDYTTGTWGTELMVYDKVEGGMRPIKRDIIKHLLIFIDFVGHRWEKII